MMYTVSVRITPSVLCTAVFIRLSVQLGIRDWGTGYRLKPVIFLRNAHDSVMHMHISANAAAQTMIDVASYICLQDGFFLMTGGLYGVWRKGL